MVNLEHCGDGGIYSDLFVFSTGSEIDAVRTEANTSDIQITILVNGLVLQFRNLVSTADFKDLC